MHYRLAALIALWTLAAATPAWAQKGGPNAGPETITATLSANLTTLAKLTLSATTLTFPDANPDIAPQVAAVEGPLSITAKARATAGSQVLLTLQATDDLRSGIQTIAASAITWTATGAGFVPGTLSKTTPVTVAQWNGSGVRSGTQTLMFENLWTYATGTYTCSLVYTLTAP
jgi:hypothetical protein